MARKKRTNRYCRDCGTWSLPEDLIYRGRCASCRDARARARRAKTGERLLGLAKESTVEIDGQTFTVKKLPPKRRSGHR